MNFTTKKWFWWCRRWWLYWVDYNEQKPKQKYTHMS